jgi:FkbM family methyltransferase
MGAFETAPEAVANPTAERIAELLGRHCVTVLDVGARGGARGARWRIPPLAKLVGFDADERECQRLAAASQPSSPERYVAKALGGASGVAELHVTADPMWSSLLAPEEHLADRYPEMAGMREVSKQPLPVVSLDTWAAAEAIEDVVFAKLDTQGSELAILQGGSRLLERCLGLEVEVEFVPLYRGVPTFSEVDAWLQERGFALWRFSELCHYAEDMKPRPQHLETVHFGGFDAQHPVGSGRLFWGNAVYFRDYAALPCSGDGARRLLVLAALLAGLGDLAASAACIGRVLDAGCPGLPDAAPSLLAAERKRLLAGPKPPKSAVRRRWRKLRRKTLALLR